MTADNRGHLIFRDKFALAVVRSASDPDDGLAVISGSFLGLRTALKSAGGGLGTLNRMIVPKAQGGLGRLQVDLESDTWRFNASGIEGDGRCCNTRHADDA